MKKILFLALILALALTACGSTPATEAINTTNSDAASEETATTSNADVPEEPVVISNSEAYVSPGLDVSYENALSARLQLNLGSLNLAQTATPITPEQARVMLPLWQALASMTRSGNNSQAEVNAVLGQIEASFTPEQLTAIRDMKLTSDSIQAWAAANGASTGTGQGGGNGQGGGGGSGMSPEARATKQAEEGVTSSEASGGNGVSTLMLDALIAYLQGLAGG